MVPTALSEQAVGLQEAMALAEAGSLLQREILVEGLRSAELRLINNALVVYQAYLETETPESALRAIYEYLVLRKDELAPLLPQATAALREGRL